MGFGMISKRYLFKGTFGFEMHFLLLKDRDNKCDRPPSAPRAQVIDTKKHFRDHSTPTLLPAANVTTLFRAKLPCLISLVLVQRLPFWSSYLGLNLRPA
jgi:hypothetical protein